MEYRLVECHPAIEEMQRCINENAVGGWTFKGVLPNNMGKHMWLIMAFERPLDTTLRK